MVTEILKAQETCTQFDTGHIHVYNVKLHPTLQLMAHLERIP